MKVELFTKAKEIEKEIIGYKNLRCTVCGKTYLRFRRYKKFFIKDDGATILINDKELAELITDYCDNKIRKLKEEMESL